MKGSFKVNLARFSSFLPLSFFVRVSLFLYSSNVPHCPRLSIYFPLLLSFIFVSPPSNLTKIPSQTISPLLSLLFLPSLLRTTTLAQDQNQPTAYFRGFTVPLCVDSAITPTSTLTRLSNPYICSDVPFFTSFRAFVENPCPPNKRPEVTAWSEKGCDGNGTSAGLLSSDSTPGPCREIRAEVSYRNFISIGGNSASFDCV